MADHAALNSRITDALAEEPAYNEAGSGSAVAWHKPAASLAVAASLVVAVFVGINQPDAGNVGGEQARVTSVAVPQTGEHAGQQFVNYGFAPQGLNNQVVNIQDSFDEDASQLRELDAEKQQMLREYLLKHDRMARMNKYERTVNFESSNP